MSDDLVKFLTARLAEDEAVAKEALLGFPLAGLSREPEIPDERWYASYHQVTQRLPWTNREEPRPKSISVADCGPANVHPARHIARHDPARVLREVAFKRAIVDDHSPGYPTYYPQPSGQPWCPACNEGSYDVEYMKWPCPTILALAAVWSDHPDYQPGWKPQKASALLPSCPNTGSFRMR